MKAMIVDIVKKFIYKCYQRDCVSAFAAQIAFFMIMSVIPFIILLGSLLPYTVVTEDTVLYLIEQFTPTMVSGFLITVVDQVYNQSIGLLSVSAILAVWSASKGVHCMVNSLNKINDLRETRNWFLVRLRAMFFTFIFLVMTVLLMVLLVFSNSITELAGNYAGEMLFGFIAAIMGRRFLILFILLIVFFACIYKFLPNRPKNASVFYQLPGAVFSAIAWYIFTFFLAIAVKYMNAFSMYGSMASLMIIMFWLYVCLTIMLICAEINVYFEKEYTYFFEKLKKKKVINRIYRRTMRIRKKQQSILGKSLKKKLYIKIPSVSSDTIEMEKHWESADIIERMEEARREEEEKKRQNQNVGS